MTIQDNASYSSDSPEFKFLITKVNELIINKRKLYLKRFSDELIRDFKTKKIYPDFDSTNLIDQFRETQLDNMVATLYLAEPKIFSSLSNIQKVTFINFLNLILDSDEKDNLFILLDKIIDLGASEKEEFTKLLGYSTMENIIKTTKLIADRYKAVEQLKKLVFNPNLKANEVNHLQTFIEAHYWLFGEQYHLAAAAERTFVEALKRFQYILHEEYDKNPEYEHPDKLKQMDIFAVRKDTSTDRITNIVVELKHPNIRIGEPQLSQVKKYMRTLQSHQEFNGSNLHWEFYLIGNKFTKDKFIEGELTSHKQHGIPSLVYNVNNCKIFVKTWSEIFTDFEIKHKYLNDQLQLEKDKLLSTEYKSADEIIQEIPENTAVQPPEIKLPV